MKAPVTHSEEGGGIYDRVKARSRIKGASVGVAPWHGREAVRRPWRGGARGGGGATDSVREGGRGRGARPGGPARPAWPLEAKRSDGPAGHWADWAES
jgi:hypothetical protein